MALRERREAALPPFALAMVRAEGRDTRSPEAFLQEARALGLREGHRASPCSDRCRPPWSDAPIATSGTSSSGPGSGTPADLSARLATTTRGAQVVPAGAVVGRCGPTGVALIKPRQLPATRPGPAQSSFAPPRGPPNHRPARPTQQYPLQNRVERPILL
jgi:hypothetical protein